MIEIDKAIEEIEKEELWRMTREEYRREQAEEFFNEYGYYPSMDLSQPVHFFVVRKAVRDGKPVPEKVLKDYPELLLEKRR